MAQLAAASPDVFQHVHVAPGRCQRFRQGDNVPMCAYARVSVFSNTSLCLVSVAKNTDLFVLSLRNRWRVITRSRQ